MSWITIAWSMAASASLTLALVHLGIWVKLRHHPAHLAFAISAVAAAGIGAAELMLMHAKTAEQIGRLMQWGHVPVFFAMVGIIAFVHFHFGTGRAWLGIAACVTRGLALIMNFVLHPNLNYREITGLRQVNFLGEQATVAIGPINSWTRLGQISSLLLLIYVIDASRGLWRLGERRRAVIVGGGITLFTLVAAVHTALVVQGVIQSPILISIPFLAIIAAAGYELSSEVARTGQLASQLKSSLEELRESEERMTLAAEAANLAHWMLDIERDEIWITEIGRRLFGFSSEERINFESFMARVHPDDCDWLRAGVEQSLQSGGAYAREFRIMLPDGTIRWIAGQGWGNSSAQGKPVSLRGISLDITARKRSEERLLLVFEAAPNVMLMLDAEGKILLVNAQIDAVFGYTAEELVGQSFDVLIPERFRTGRLGDRNLYLQKTYKPAISEGSELFGRCKDGKEFPVEIGLNPITSPEGSLVLVSIIDVTERRRAEAERGRQLHELAHLSRIAMLGELTSGLAHELNQPLTAILTNAQAARRFLSSGAPNLEQLREILDDIANDDKRAGQIIGRLQAMVRKEPVSRETFNLNDLLREAGRILHGELIEQHITLTMELMPGLPLVCAGSIEIQQVIINLVLNAVQAQKETTPALRHVLIRTEQHDSTVVVAIRDAGCGISEAMLPNIFEPFVTTRPNGLGMGLAISRRLLEAYGGSIQARNNPQGGATFLFMLPIANGKVSLSHGKL